MREIKFRAWEKRNVIMRTWDWLKDAHPFQMYFDSKDYEVMQFTGFKDKNGKEIYEGDLLEVDLEKFGVQDKAFQVIWEDDGWALKDLSDPSLTAYIFYDKDRLEVIGNIYENPELLGKETND